MTLATSMGSALRFCAVTCSPRLTCSGSSLAERGVLTDPARDKPTSMSRNGDVASLDSPGATQFTRIVWFSFAAVRVAAITAALLAQYATLPGAPICPNVLDAETYGHTVSA